MPRTAAHCTTAFRTCAHSRSLRQVLLNLLYSPNPNPTPHPHQVLLNLLYNAVKFTVHGSVTLSAEVQEETQTHFFVLVRVADQGIGISKEDQSKLFGMFAKIKDARVRNPLGVGLGLAICKQLVEMMGGQIWVDSTYGEGSTFSFTLQVTLPRPLTQKLTLILALTLPLTLTLLLHAAAREDRERGGDDSARGGGAPREGRATHGALGPLAAHLGGRGQ